MFDLFLEARAEILTFFCIFEDIKMSFWFCGFDQNTNENSLRISALVSKKKSSQIIFTWLKINEMPLFFWFNLFLEVRRESLQKFRWFFGRFEDTKRTFRNWPTFITIGRTMGTHWRVLLDSCTRNDRFYLVLLMLESGMALFHCSSHRILATWYCTWIRT